MTRFHAMLVPVALLVVAGTAHAQRWSGGAAVASRTRSSSTEARQVAQASGGAWNGTASKWGGSPVQQRATARPRIAYIGQVNAYIPVAVAAVAPEVYAADTGCTTTPSEPVEMQVITSNREPRQLTTIEVYRLQPRFRKP